jgi:RNA polymerase sigma-70 factor (ECF subfamily)
VVAIQGGDDDRSHVDFDELYRRHAADVSRWAARLAGPGHDVEDVVQEVFTVALRRSSAYDAERGELGAWLHGITVRTVQARRRKHRLRDWLLREVLRWRRGTLVTGRDADLVDRSPDPEQQLVHAEARRRLYGLLDELPEATRAAFVLYEIEELDGARIAATLGISVANVWVRLHRARKHLAAALKEERP